MSKKINPKTPVSTLSWAPPSVTIGTITYTAPTMTVPGTVNPTGTPVSGMCQNTTTLQMYMPDPTPPGGGSWPMTYTNLPPGTYNVQAYMTCSTGSASDQVQFIIR